MDIEQEIQAIKLRNKKVEADKAWEGSWIRKLSVALITYAFMTMFFSVIGVENPFINSLVPTFGYLLSTLGLSFIKKYWLQKYSKNQS